MIKLTEVINKEINKNWEVKRVGINKTFTDQWVAIVEYICKDDSGNEIDRFQKRYVGEEYNKWFSEFSSGEFLLQELKRLKSFDVEVVVSEAEFMNSISKSVAEDIAVEQLNNKI